MTTTLLTKQNAHFHVEDAWPRKRFKTTGDFIEPSAPVADDDDDTQQSQRARRRRKLDEIYEADRSELESNIETNINVELERCKRRRQQSEPTKMAYDHETVKAMIAVALETQKEKLFATFIEQNLEDLQYYEQVVDTLFKTHALNTNSLAESYIN